ncbi:LPS export ABC transporter periplasmic protein LptC [Alphaproteobacteria bacterium]|nr:LPS export ABC transporter periplasmic protein LptC [Alphaproteobacteria bacterium]
MNNIFEKNKFNILIILLLISQIFIFFINSPIEKIALNYQSNSLEKFTTMISGDKGIDIIKADKMIKINENKTILIGNTSLKNTEYEIKSKNVTVDSHNQITSSIKETKTTNSQGTIKSEGFKYDQKNNIIEFNGKSEFHTNDN